MKTKTRLFTVLLILVLFLSACNLPSGNNNQGEGLSLTAAAQTVEALLSATPSTGITSTTTSAVPATITLIPSPIFTNTPAATATPNCPLAQFVTDVTIPDGTVINPGQTFNKKWRLKNIGACAWNGYSLVFDSGESMNGPATKAVGTVNPGQEIDVDVDLKAPGSAGNYRGYWRLVTNSNVLVPIVSGYQGRAFYVDIKVQVATPTNTPAPAFAVTSVTYNISGVCGNFHISANITTNGAGAVTFYWQANGYDDFEGTYGSTLNFATAETKTTSTIDWAISASGSHYLKVYIDNPNHQFFGQTPNMICP